MGSAPRKLPRGTKDSLLFQAATAILCFFGTLILFSAQFQKRTAQTLPVSSPDLVAAASLPAPQELPVVRESVPETEKATAEMAAVEISEPSDRAEVSPEEAAAPPSIEVAEPELTSKKVEAAKNEVSEIPEVRLAPVAAPALDVQKEAPPVLAEALSEDVATESGNTVDASLDEVLEAAIDSDTELLDSSLAVDLADAQDLLVAAAIEPTEPSGVEGESSAAPDSEPRAWQFDAQVEFDKSNPREPVIQEVVGWYQKNDYSNLRTELEAIRNHAAPLLAEQELAVSGIRRPAEVMNLVRARTPQPAVVTPVVAVAPATIPAPAAKAPLAVGLRMEAGLSLPRIPNALVSVAAEKAPELPKARTETVGAPAMPGHTVMEVQTGFPKEDPKAEQAPDLRTWDDALSGTLYIEEDLRKFLRATRGHVELYLHPEKSRDPKDTIFIGAQYPNHEEASLSDSEDPRSIEFHYAQPGLRGRYQLVAGVFLPKAIGPVSQVVYGRDVNGKRIPKWISFDTVKEHAHFKVDYRAAYDGYAQTRRSGKSVSVWMTVFNANSSNYLEPDPVPFAQVRLLGMPERGTLRADKDGSVLLAGIPAASEFVVEVSGDKHLRTFQTVTVAGGDLDLPVYLLNEKRVKTLSQIYTKTEQKRTNCAVMGRAFDPDTRDPIAGEEFSLTSRKKRALYFGKSFPDPDRRDTSESGQWAYFNVKVKTPSFRFLDRVRNPEAAAYVLHCRPDAGTYVELGRGGATTLMGKLRDERGPIVGASISLIGDDRVRAVTNEQGVFSIPKLDLPQDVVTFQVTAAGYPTALHTVPWNPRERNPRRVLFQHSSRELDSAKWEAAKPGTGRVVVRTRKQTLKAHPGCLSVKLQDLEEVPVDPNAGPHPLVLRGHREPHMPGCVDAGAPDVFFENLAPGEYMVSWSNADKEVVATRIVRVGVDHTSFLRR